MGDGTSSGANQKHDPAELRVAADALCALANRFEREAIHTFNRSMGPYTLKVLTVVADERGRRIRGESYDHAKAEQKGITSGATSDWLNPFGRFHEADLIQERMDQAYQAAVRDGRRVLGEITDMANALKAAADFYDDNEHTNTQLTKAIMDHFLASGPAPEKA